MKIINTAFAIWVCLWLVLGVPIAWHTGSVPGPISAGLYIFAMSAGTALWYLAALIVNKAWRLLTA